MAHFDTRVGARRRPNVGLAVALVLTTTLLAAACGGAEPAGDGTAGSATPPAALTVVATTSILGDVAAQVAGDAAEVVTVMPPGSDPHSFEASAQEMAQLQEADLVVANGGNLEQQLAGALDEAEGAGVPVFHALDHVDALSFAGHEGDDGHAEGDSDEHGSEGATEEHHDESDHEGEGEGESESESDHDSGDEAHDHGETDPHFWMDPVRAAAVARALGAEIAELTDSDVESSADAYATRLEELDAAVDEQLATVPDAQRKLVTNHEAFGYFADRYGFDVVGTVIPSVTTGAEPSARDLEDLAATIEREQVGAIFAETTAPDRLATTLAQEVGADVTVVELYSGSLGEEGSGAETYTAMLRTNADRIADALGG